jgi:hypothetical protein
MRLFKMALCVGPLVVLGCDSSNPAEPDLPLGPEAMVAECGCGCWNPCEPPPPPPAMGRFTGGGVVRLVDDIKITHGFTLHCDELLSNNLEINHGGDQWHINPKGEFLDVSCWDDPAVDPEPPPAPVDNIEATARGRWNGQPGYTVHFHLMDAGEPGGKGDMAGLTIRSPGGAVVLEAAFDFTLTGNIQAHYDQPHGSKPNK